MGDTGEFLSTAQVGKFLGITPRMVHRLVRDGFLEIKGTRKFKFGEDFYFDRVEVEELSGRMPEFKRKWQSEEDSRLGAKKASFKRYQSLRKSSAYRNFKDRYLSSLEGIPEKTAALLRVSFYLYHLNHYAKKGEGYLYDLKEKVLKKILEEFSERDCLTVCFVEGDPKVHLCETCRLKAQKSGMDYVKYKNTSGGCPRCKKESNYYSLFEFQLEYGEHSFCFHTPFSAARKWFEDIDELEIKVRDKSREEGIAFGRPISEAEARAVVLDEIIKELENFIGG